MARRRVKAALDVLAACVAALALFVLAPATARGEAELESARTHFERGANVHVHAQLAPVEAPEPPVPAAPPPRAEEPDAAEDPAPPRPLEPRDRRRLGGPDAAEDPAPPRPLEPRDRRRLGPSAFWITAGVAAAALVSGGVLGVLALVEEDRFEELNIPTRPPEQEAPLRESHDRGEALPVGRSALQPRGRRRRRRWSSPSSPTDHRRSECEAPARRRRGARGSF